MAPKIGNEIFGRPTLLDLQARAKSATGNYITERLLRSSLLLQVLTWDTEEINKDLSKVYKRKNVIRVGQSRDLNTDYAPKMAGGETDVTTKAGIFGDAYEWDRVAGAVDPTEVETQVNAMAPGVANRFSDEVVNGVKGVTKFDGLSAVAESIGGNALVSDLDLTLGDTGNNLKFRQNYAKIVKAIRRMIALGWRPVVIGNTDVQGAFDLSAEIIRANTVSDYFGGQHVTTLAGAALIDPGMANVYGTPVTDAQGRQVYPVEQKEVIPSVIDTSGVITDIYVVGIGLTGVTGITLPGFDARTPASFQTARNDAGAIRRAEIEMVAGLAVVDDRAVVKFSDAKVG